MDFITPIYEFIFDSSENCKKRTASKKSELRDKVAIKRKKSGLRDKVAIKRKK